MNYHLRTPLDGYKNKFDISLYQWSSSWLDVKITPTDLVYDDTFSKQKLISPAGASLDEMRERSDASLLLTIGSNTSFTMLLSVELRFRFADVHKTRNEESVYWRNKYHITKKEHAPIILTLSGEMHFVNISSNTTVMAWVVYQWLFDTTKPKVSPLCTKSAKLSRNLRRKRSRPRFDITIGSRFGTYHFLKTCHCGSCLPCPRNNYTWNKAYNICKRKGLELPQLFSRNEQRELQRIIQLSDCLYFIEAVFLALTKTTSGWLLFWLWEICVSQVNLYHFPEYILLYIISGWAGGLTFQSHFKVGPIIFMARRNLPNVWKRNWPALWIPLKCVNSKL